jgi:CSLREA domain-containing protein
MAVVVAPASEVEASNFTVNKTADTIDANIGDGKCDVDLGTTGYQCTLRAAIQEVNSLGGTNTISISISGGGTIHLLSALPTITDDDLTIHGSTTVTIKTDGNWNGLTVNADGVTLTSLVLNGDGSTADGLDFLPGAGDATVTSATIHDFHGNGIQFEGNNDDNTITGAEIDDVGVGGADGILFAAGGSDGNVIKSTTITDGSGTGIEIDGLNSDDNLVSGCTITSNGVDGVSIAGGSGNTVASSTVNENGVAGVYLSDGDDSTVSNSTIDENDHYGIELMSEDDAVIENNVIGDNDDAQIYIHGPTSGDISVYSNDIDTGSDGIVVLAGTTGNIDIGTDDDYCNQFEGDLDQSGGADPTDDWYVENDSTLDLDATNNAWGDADSTSEVEDTICGEDATDCTVAVTGDVDFDDWLDDCAGAAVSTATHTPTPSQSYTPTPSSTPTRTPTPVPGAATATPTTGPMESVTLVAGCNPVASTYPDNTPIATIGGAVSPSTNLISIWWFDAANGRWLGYSPQFVAESDLTAVDRLEAIFICVSAASTWSRPLI